MQTEIKDIGVKPRVGQRGGISLFSLFYALLIQEKSFFCLVRRKGDKKPIKNSPLSSTIKKVTKWSAGDLESRIQKSTPFWQAILNKIKH